MAHLNLPKTLEGFYQESGRAGRDGLPSRSVLFYDVDDRERMDYILGGPPAPVCVNNVAVDMTCIGHTHSFSGRRQQRAQIV